MTILSFRHRSTEPEIMDDFGVRGEELQRALNDITWVNKRLGGNGISISALEEWVNHHLEIKQKTIRLADLGCGNGDTLRRMARWGRAQQLNLELVGLDANTHSIALAREQSRDFPEISYKTADVLSPEYSYSGFDLAHCSLFLHHFGEKEIMSLLNKLRVDGVLGLLINDLQRSPVAYYAFAMVARVVRISPMARHDGLVSVKKGFQRKELTDILHKGGLSPSKIKWKWAFRYQVSASFTS